MSAHALQFLVPRRIGRKRIRALLLELGAEHAAPRSSVQRTWYDTFDWRLYRHQRALLGEPEGKHKRLTYSDRNGATVRARTLAAPEARFVRELPRGTLRDALAPLIKTRVLLAQVLQTGRTEPLLLRNPNEKTVLRLALEDLEVTTPGHNATHRLQCVRLDPVRGYAGVLRRVQRTLQSESLEPLPEGLLGHALALLGIEPEQYTGKVMVTLTPDMRADEATRSLLRELLGIMYANEAGVIAGLDSEFLHDFRIAVRQSRTLLGLMKRVFPQRTVQRFRVRLAWLGQLTGPTRDMDVYLLKFPAYQSTLPAAVRPDLEPLREFLQHQQRGEHTRLAKSLRSARYAKLAQDWEEFLQMPAPVNTRLANAARPILAVANERIWRTYRGVMRHGKAISDDSPAAVLHDLRKRCKKLRYLLELFYSLYSDRPMKQLIKELKKLQDVLGDFQDLHVQISSLGQFAAQMQGQGELTPRTEKAIAVLIEALAQRQADCRRGFDERFARFACKQNRQSFTRLFSAPAQPLV
ncbi:MAG: CHAD domain-containing protein [Pseudomonadota bacterium]|nr:MAG: CHAD domain-containing protein [Pseudomonadota bacterium]